MAACMIISLVPKDASGEVNGNIVQWTTSVRAVSRQLDKENGGLLQFILTNGQKVQENALAAARGQAQPYATDANGVIEPLPEYTMAEYPETPEYDPDHNLDEEQKDRLNFQLKMYAIAETKAQRHNAKTIKHHEQMEILRTGVITSLAAIPNDKMAILFNVDNPINSCPLLFIMTTIEAEYGQTKAEKVASARKELTVKPKDLTQVEDWDKKQTALTGELTACLPPGATAEEPAEIKFDRYCEMLANVPGAEAVMTLFKAQTATHVVRRTAARLVTFIKTYVEDNRVKLVSEVIAMKAAEASSVDAKAMAATRERTFTKAELEAAIEKAVRQAAAEAKKGGDSGGKATPKHNTETTLTDKHPASPCYKHTAKRGTQAGHSNAECKHK